MNPIPLNPALKPYFSEKYLVAVRRGGRIFPTARSQGCSPMHKSNLRGQRNFPTTRWSLVVRASAVEDPTTRPALSQLLVNYLGPMRLHLITRNGVSPQETDDLLQSFVADRLLEDNLLASAIQGRGRFRNFLLTALDHFVFNHFRTLRAQKRRPKAGLISDEQVDLVDPAPPADKSFDRAWAREVLNQAVAAMREECRFENRPDVWGVFESRVLLPILESAKPIPYRDLVSRFGFASPSDASNVHVTGIRMFRRALRSVIGRYEPDKQGIEEELDDLRRILSNDGARYA
jgi:DNA-directed RNA polymerase specialized sigma24 family protein